MGTPTQSQQAERFRALHTGPRMLVLPNAWDAVSARLIEEGGFPAIATSSAGVAWALGYADGERISRGEMLAVVRRIAQAVRIPVTADVEAGYGATAGAAARVPLVVNARTDAFEVKHWSPAERFTAAVRRANAYRAAGADCLFVPHVSDADTIERLAREIAGPLNIIAGPPAPPLGQLESLGVRRASFGPRIVQATLGLIRRITSELRERGTYDALADLVIPFGEIQRLFAR